MTAKMIVPLMVLGLMFGSVQEANARDCEGKDAELLDAYVDAWTGRLPDGGRHRVRAFVTTFVAPEYRMVQKACEDAAGDGDTDGDGDVTEPGDPCYRARATSINAFPSRRTGGRVALGKYILKSRAELGAAYANGDATKASWDFDDSDCAVDSGSGADPEKWKIRWQLKVFDTDTDPATAIYTLTADSVMDVEGDTGEDRTLRAEHTEILSEAR